MVATIKRKTALALKKAGGIMIWQLLGDAAGDSSLLTAIYHIAGKNSDKGHREHFKAKIK